MAALVHSAEQLAGWADHRCARTSPKPHNPVERRQYARDNWEMHRAIREVFGKCLAITNGRDDFSRDDESTGV